MLPNLVLKVGLRGSVVRAANIAPLITELNFTCSRCSSEVISITVEGRFEYPSSCPKKCTLGRTNAPKKRVPLFFVVSSNFDIQFLETKYEFPVFVGTDDIVRCLNIRCIFRYWHFANFSPSVSAVLRGRFARFTVNREKCRGIDWQRIRLQEDFSELATGTQRRMPRTVDCDLKRSLVGSCVPGDVVTLPHWALP